MFVLIVEVCFDCRSLFWSDSNRKLFCMVLTFPNAVQNEPEMSLWGKKVFDAFVRKWIKKGGRIKPCYVSTWDSRRRAGHKESDTLLKKMIFCFRKKSPVSLIQSWAHLSDQQDEPFEGLDLILHYWYRARERMIGQKGTNHSVLQPLLLVKPLLLK